MATDIQQEDGVIGVLDYGCHETMFQTLCSNVATAMLGHHEMLQELLALKDELLTYPLPSNMLVALSVMISRVYRSYGDLCSPVGELSRLAQLHSQPWEKNSEGLRKIRQDYDSMKRKMNITLQMMQGLSAQEGQRLHERRLGHWERLYCHVMQSKSHGRRWKFRIEPLRRKIASGWNPFQESDSSSSDSEELESKTEDSVEPFQSVSSKSTVERISATGHISEELSEEASEGLSGKSAAITPVQLVDASMDTSDPTFHNYLLVHLHRPTGIAESVNIVCTIALGNIFYTSEVYPVVPDDPEAPSCQSFHFPLSEEEVRDVTTRSQSPESSYRMVVGVYPRSISQPLAATLSLSITHLHIGEEPIVIVPPQCRDQEFEVDWQKLSNEVSEVPTYPYLLSLQKEREQVDYEVEEPLLHMTCHRVKVQNHQLMHCGTVTTDWNTLMSALGYVSVPETQSRAISAMTLDCHSPTPIQEEADVGPTRSEVRVQLEKNLEDTVNKLEEEHHLKISRLESHYQEKMRSLSRTLAQVKAENTKRIAELEETLVEMEGLMGKGKRSLADVKHMVQRRKATVNLGLPQWGKDLPEDFLERLDMFNEERSRRKEEHVDKIKREVSRVCEEQLAVQHRLAPGRNFSLEYDLSLPAIFLPSSKNLVFSPRARQFFHPTGSDKRRLTQPPAVFKLPPLRLEQPVPPSTCQMPSTQHAYPITGNAPAAHHVTSPMTTPAPPPSSCDNYPRPPSRPRTTSVLPGSSSPPLFPWRQRRHSAHGGGRELREELKSPLFEDDTQT